MLFDRASQRLLELEATARGDQRLGAIHAGAVPTHFLGTEQRGVSSAQQGWHVAAVIGKYGGAEAHADQQLALAHSERPMKFGHHLLGAPLEFLKSFRALEDQGELVTAEPRHEATVTSRSAQAFADHAQHAIAKLVSQAVIDHLEVIEI